MVTELDRHPGNVCCNKCGSKYQWIRRDEKKKYICHRHKQVDYVTRHVWIGYKEITGTIIGCKNNKCDNYLCWDCYQKTYQIPPEILQ